MKRTLRNIALTAMAEAALLFGCSGPEYIPAPPVLTTHTPRPVITAPVGPAPGPVEPTPVEKPKPLLTEIVIEYTINSPKAFESVCRRVEEEKGMQDEFEKIKLARRLDKKGDGVLSAEETFAAYESKNETLRHAQQVLAGEGEEKFIEETVNQELQGKGLKEKIAFVQKLRSETAQGSYKEAMQIEVQYQIENMPAFEALCEAVSRKESRDLDTFDKIVLASQIDSDNDGKVTLQDIAKRYVQVSGEEPSTIRYSTVVETPQGGMSELVARRLKGLTLDQKIELVKGFLSTTKRNYNVEKKAQPYLQAILDEEKIGIDNEEKVRAVCQLIDADKNFTVSDVECARYIEGKGSEYKAKITARLK
ncbi:hypothetical protein KY309_01075 [Candidatus Woesearchaeota archaeon]|nr:hypothetical protein [Candidatus Woesearchaeota archaeon]MBW3016186.1 hypothetical protein [Candidatus Woesearchaeota archaeon]